MSIQSFLSKLWLDIKSLFDSLPADLQQAAHIAVTITENLKTVVDSPAMDLLTAIVPGDTDDRIVNFMRLRLPVILQELRLVDSSLSYKTSNEVLINGATTIQSLTGDIQNAFLHDLGVLITREISSIQNKGLSWTDAVYIIEWYYQNRFKKTVNA